MAVNALQRNKRSRRRRRRSTSENRAKPISNTAGGSTKTSANWAIANSTDFHLTRPRSYPISVNGLSGLLVRGSELIGPIFQGANSLLSDGFYYSPGLGYTPLLDKLSVPYTRYIPHKMMLRFTPVKPTTSNGTVTIYSRTDVESPPVPNVVEAMQLGESQASTTNIFNPVGKYVKFLDTKEHFYLPTITSTESTATLRQTMCTYMGFLIQLGDSSETGKLQGYLVLDYEVSIFAQEPESAQYDSTNYAVQCKVPAGQTYSDVVPYFSPNWVRSRINKNRWKYIGPERKFDLTVEARIAGDFAVTPFLPILTTATNVPIDTTLTVLSRELTYVNENVATAHIESMIPNGCILEFPVTPLPAETILVIDFDKAKEDKGTNVFDF